MVWPFEAHTFRILAIIGVTDTKREILIAAKDEKFFAKAVRKLK